MSGIRSKDTRPEMIVRRGLHAAGFRFRLHNRSIPGTPDMVFPKWKAVIFVHGCFWHGHNCHMFKWPSTRREFWELKITRNQKNDFVNTNKLLVEGWRLGIVWECALRGKKRMPTGEVILALGKWLTSEAPFIELGSPTNEPAEQ